jgi:hypothetical protein
MAGKALLSPIVRAETVELSSTLFRKQILPLGTITYKGRKIAFDKKYLTDLAASFQANAFDQVPFQLADADNRHTMDPERFRGEVKGVELTDKGLTALVELTPDAAELVRKNPKLGVSARIIEGYDRSDGQKFPHALHHVLGTLDPKVVGMKPWQEVALSEEVDSTEDYTDQTIKPPAASAPQNNGAEDDLSDLEGLDLEDLDGLTDEELALLTNDGGGVVSEALLANQAASDQRIAALELDLAREKFDNEATQLITSGVPPALVNLARPLLSLPRTPIIELSNGEDPIDVGGIVRDLLGTCKGIVKLANEQGSSSPFGLEDNDEDRADAVLKAWRGGQV